MPNHIEYKQGYKYQLETDVEFRMPVEFNKFAIAIETDYYKFAYPTLTVKRGYAWDGTSGPTPNLKSSKRASLVHDVIYQMIAENGMHYDVREHADQWFSTLLKDDGMWKPLRFIYWLAVHVFGSGPARTINPIIKAP